MRVRGWVEFAGTVRDMASGYFTCAGGSCGVVWGELNGGKVLSISEMEME